MFSFLEMANMGEGRGGVLGAWWHWVLSLHLPPSGQVGGWREGGMGQEGGFLGTPAPPYTPTPSVHPNNMSTCLKTGYFTPVG